MKIHIITGSFTPDINPRSFRSAELAKYFATSGHTVTVTNLSFTPNYDYKNLEKELGIHITNIPIYYHSNTINSVKTTISNKKLYSIIKFFAKYFVCGKMFLHKRQVLQNLSIDIDVDLVISISVPFVTHYSVSSYRKRNHKLFAHTCFVADSGDPFSTCQQFKIAPYFKLLEKNVYKQFEYLAIPTHAAKSAYKSLVSQEKIKIIPQGFDFEINKAFPQYVKNAIPTFAYAGVFYKGIRNPEFLFKYLSELDRQFKFILFLREKDVFIESILNKYSSKLNGKVCTYYGTLRKDLLCKLATMDFLINIGNTTNIQVPSKLIDYALANRPFISFTEKTFNKTQFLDFMDGNYDAADVVNNLDIYNIKNVSKQFLSLVNRK